jgi:mannosyltransferase
MAIHYKTLLLLTLVVLFAAVTRLYHLDRESLWLDESTSYWWAKTSPTEIVTWAAGDTHTPLYYLLLHYWMKISGDSDWAIRLLSAIFGISAIPVVFQIGKLLFSERFGLVAALFLTVSGFHIQYSQEARPYSLYFFLTSVSILFSILAHKGIRYSWFGYVVSTVSLLYTHNTAVLAVVAIMLFYLILAWPSRYPAINSFLIATLVVLILYAPWVPVYLSQLTLVREDWWASALTVKQALKTLHKLVLFPQTIPSLGWIQYGLLWLPFSILLLAVPHVWSKEKKTLTAMALLFLIPVGVNLIFSTTIRNTFILRLLTPALLALPFLWATPVLMERRASYRQLALTAMISMFLISLAGSIHFLVSNFKEPWRQLVESFQENYKPGDEVLYLMAYNRKPFTRYLPPNLSGLPVVAIEQDKTGIPALLASKKTNARRLWLVRRYGGIRSRDKALIHKTVAWLDTNYKKLSEWKLKNLEMVLYEPL